MLEINGVRATKTVLMDRNTESGLYEVYPPILENKRGERLAMIQRQEDMNWEAPVRVYASDALVDAITEDGAEASLNMLEQDGRFMLCLEEEV